MNQNIEIIDIRPKFQETRIASVLKGLAAVAIASLAIGTETSASRPNEDQGRYGPGVWVTNEASGYYIGRSFRGDTMEKHINSTSDDYAYGLIKRGWNKLEQCGWIESSAITPNVPLAEKSDCAPHLERLKKRWSFGKKFNCLPARCVDGKETTMSRNKACDHKFFYNYAPPKKGSRNISFPETEGGLYDYAGRQYGEVRYRYTTKDSRAVVVRSYKYGWGYLEADCVDGHPRGGPKKHSTTTPGRFPNQHRK